LNVWNGSAKPSATSRTTYGRFPPVEGEDGLAGEFRQWVKNFRSSIGRFSAKIRSLGSESTFFLSL
jgi:hypothetical protein